MLGGPALNRKGIDDASFPAVFGRVFVLGVEKNHRSSEVLLIDKRLAL